eukprot:6184278-Pleurochrysis_carterae.AAC.1
MEAEMKGWMWTAREQSGGERSGGTCEGSQTRLREGASARRDETTEARTHERKVAPADARSCTRVHTYMECKHVRAR